MWDVQDTTKHTNFGVLDPNRAFKTLNLRTWGRVWRPNWEGPEIWGEWGVSTPKFGVRAPNLGVQDPKFRVPELKFGHLGGSGLKIWGFQDANSREETSL